MEPTFSLIYTSCRSDRIVAVLKDWEEKSKLRDFEIILTVDSKDSKSQQVAKSIEAIAATAVAMGKLKKFVWLIQSDEPFNCVKGWNLAARHASGKVLVQLTDDFVPPIHWDEKLLAIDGGRWVEREHVVHINDGYVQNLCTLAILTRKRYDRFGYLFYPGYESLFCDTELTEVAYRDGVVIEAMHLVFEHMHPDCNKRLRDETDLVHASQDRWQRGEMLFNFRKFRGFPQDEGPNAINDTSPAVAHDFKFAAYIQATRDDFCLFEVCERLKEEGVNDFFFSVPDEYWSGRVTPPEDIAQVKAVASLVISKLGANAKITIHKVKTYRFPGDTRLAVETRVRNDALTWIRKEGFQHVLIVDGDELWKRGTLDLLKHIIREYRPTAISSNMIPVVGLPGYPVDRAQDVAVVYISDKTPFRECRTPIGEQFRLGMAQVIHFTGTRRTMDEIVEKHRQSGHYDDPDYDFEGWLRDILPNIKPGLQNVHMYKKYQIWPAIREWWAAEIEEIPESLWPYLAIARQA
jgi:glycosyltransferase involved in cell wall biosynthesis